VKDRVAIVGVGTTRYERESSRSELALALAACRNAIADAGLTAADVDGISGSWLRAETVQGALGIPRCTWYANTVPPPFHLQVVAAVHAIAAGACETALVYHASRRAPRRGLLRAVLPPPSPWPDSIAPTAAYATWASRYLHDYGATREHLGLVAVNGRTNAGLNEHAALSEPMTMADYLAAPLIHAPLGRLDMDYGIDGADALVLTTSERALEGPHRPVLVHAAALGQTRYAVEENLPDLAHSGLDVAGEALWSRSDLSLGDVDVFFPYDGFTIIALKWIEAAGWCAPGEGAALLEDSWVEGERRLRIGGRVLVNTHGGSLSEGATQGAGHVREAVVQLRGAAGARQVPGAEVALVAGGGFFFNAGALLLRI
jgi:acetyl-CoA acetyltransferase